MKQTIRTQNYTTTIDIPIDKLKSKCTHSQCPPSYPQNQSITHHVCCVSPCNNGNNSSINVEMIEQLQKLYQDDVRELNSSIEKYKDRCLLLESEVEGERMRSSKYKEQMQAIERQLIIARQNYEQKMQILRQESKQEYNKLMGTKIAEYQSKYLISQQQHNLLLEKMQQKNLSQLEQTTAHYKAIITQLKDQKTQQINIHLRELQNFKEKNQNSIKQLTSNFQNKVIMLEEQNKNLEKDKENLRALVQKWEQFQQKYLDEKQKNSSLFLLLEQERERQAKLQSNQNLFMSQELEKYSIREQQLKRQYSNALLQKRMLEQKHTANFIELENMAKQFQILQRMVRSQEAQIHKLKGQLKGKDEVKNYEVKIERVVDRGDYISQLQNQIERFKYEISGWRQGEQNQKRVIKEKESIIVKMNGEIGELRERIRELEIYIEKKEKSFEWIVEKEILKDIRIAEQANLKPAYKVYQMKEQRRASGSQIRSNEQLSNIMKKGLEQHITNNCHPQNIERNQPKGPHQVNQTLQQNIANHIYQFNDDTYSPTHNNSLNQAALMMLGNSGNLPRNR